MGVLAACVTALASCQREAVPEPVNALSEEDPATRTSMTIGSNNSVSFQWEDSDKLKVRQVFHKNGSNHTEVKESNAPVWNASGNYYSLSAPFTVQSSYPDTYFNGYRYLYQGFYPSSQVSQSGSSVYLTLPAQQTPRSETLYDASADLVMSPAVYSMGQRTSLNNKPVNGISFNRLSAVAVMHVSGSPSVLSGTGGAVRYVEFIASQPLAGTYKFTVGNPDTPQLQSSSTSSTIKVDFSGITTNRNNFTVCFCCLPATCSSYTVRIVTTKGTYYKSFTTTQTFTQGQARFFTVNMSDAQMVSTTVRLMTYNVAAFRLYDQHTVRHQIYRDNQHWWKRDGGPFVLYDNNDFRQNRRDNRGDSIITHAARVINTQFNAGIPTLIGLNELDCHLRRKLSNSANVRHKTGTNSYTTVTISKDSVVDRYFELKQLKEKLVPISGHTWGYYFAKARTFGSEPNHTVGNGELKKAYGNGILTSKTSDSYPFTFHNLGNGNGDGEEDRCVAVLETEDCVFASVHMGGVGDGDRLNVIANQIAVMNAWFSDHYAGCHKPVFVCGDFNAFPDEIGNLMNSNWTLLTRTDINTHSNGCLDYIFCYKHAAPARALSSTVIQSVSTSIAPYGVSAISDHLPMTALVECYPVAD